MNNDVTPGPTPDLAPQAAPRRPGLPDVSTLAGAHEEIANLKLAVGSRTMIGQAIGIYMERYDLDAEAAFAAISRLSQNTNKKLYEVAVEIAARAQGPE